jgi:hypothetical protein
MALWDKEVDNGFDISSTRAIEAAQQEITRNQIITWLPSEIARQPGILKTYEDALAKDVAEHSINFSRYGDFVCVKQCRQGRPQMRAIMLGRSEYPPPPKDSLRGKQSGLRPATVVMEAGKAPSLDNSGTAYKSSGGFVTYIPGRFGTWPYMSHSRIEVSVETGLADVAHDDVLNFAGAGVEVRVPFGCGVEAFDKLMAALAADEFPLTS